MTEEILTPADVKFETDISHGPFGSISTSAPKGYVVGLSSLDDTVRISFWAEGKPMVMVMESVPQSEITTREIREHIFYHYQNYNPDSHISPSTILTELAENN